MGGVSKCPVQVGLRVGVVGIKSKGLPIAINRVQHLPPSRQSQTKVVVSVGESRHQLDGSPDGRDGFVETLLLYQRQAQVVVAGGQIGLQAERFSKALLSLGELSLLRQSDPQVAVRSSAGRRQANCSPEALLRIRRLAHVEGSQS